MNRYMITGKPLRLVDAVLGLTEEQAKPRLHNLEHLKKKGTFKATSPVIFKVGEIIGFDGDLPKSQAKLIECKVKEKPDPEAEILKIEQVNQTRA